MCHAHEHVYIGPSAATDRFPEFRLDDRERIIRELREVRRAGGGTMVDSMPCGAGRDIDALVEISERSGLHLVAATGAHLARYYASGHWSGSYSVEQLAGLFVAEIEQGIDRNDCTGPLVERSGARAGVIKVASGAPMTGREERLFEAAARAHARTGAPILTHTEGGKGAHEQIALFQSFGVSLGHVVLSHTDRNPDPGFHRDLLRSGVCLEYDGAFRWKPSGGNPTLELILGLSGDFPAQLMLGMDAARPTYWRSFGGQPGLTYLLETFSGLLRAGGFAEIDLARLLVHNPARAFAFNRS